MPKIQAPSNNRQILNKEVCRLFSFPMYSNTTPAATLNLDRECSDSDRAAAELMPFVPLQVASCLSH